MQSVNASSLSVPELRNAGVPQTPHIEGLIADRDITLRDSIMSDNLKDEDEERLYNIPKICQKAHSQSQHSLPANTR